MLMEKKWKIELFQKYSVGNWYKNLCKTSLALYASCKKILILAYGTLYSNCSLNQYLLLDKEAHRIE